MEKINNEIVLQVKNITKTFSIDKEFNALDNVSFEVYKNDFVVLAGANGSGKSLLMNIITDLENATSGTVELFNNKVGLVFQDADSQILGETLEEDVLFGISHLYPKSECTKIVDEVLSYVGLLEYKNNSARFLSGGQKRKLAVASILALKKDIIIFDEPYANLDYTGVKQVNSILQKLKQDKTIIILTHELEKVLALSNRFIILDKGKIVFDGNASDGLKLDLEKYAIRNPMNSYKSCKDLLW